jgi:3-deoxy-D-manno-octulosonic-acid transferase
MHAPSVGEGLQAKPVLEAMRRRHPSLQLAYTYFSPSAELFAQRLREEGLADFADYLPWDTAHDTARALAALSPTALVFAKLDVWPMLVRIAADRHTRLGLISATVSAVSSRRSRAATAFLRDAYARLDAVGATTEADAERLRTLGVRTTTLRVTGDTRYDQVWTRAQSVDRSATPLDALLAVPRPTLVAGSTWPPDERVVLAGWASLRRHFPSLRLVLAPHEPTASHLMPVEHWATEHGYRVARLGADAMSTADLVLVDRVGVLGALYAIADVAYIGGGFHGAGLHSVIEPAAFGAPVVFGPRHQSSADAERLLAAGGARVVTDDATFAATVGAWFAEEAKRREAGARARQVVASGLGATERSVEMIEGLLGM